MQGDPVDTATESVERLAAALVCNKIGGELYSRQVADALRALAAERDQEAAFKAAAYKSRDSARADRDSAIARAEAAEAAYSEAARLAAEKADQLGEMRAERDGIRADQQRAIADNLTLGAQVWKRAMRHAASIAAGMGAGPTLVRVLRDQDDVHSAPPGALDPSA